MVKFTAAENSSSSEVQDFWEPVSFFRPIAINSEAVLDARDYECSHEYSDDAIREIVARVGETNQQCRTPAADSET